MADTKNLVLAGGIAYLLYRMSHQQTVIPYAPTVTPGSGIGFPTGLTPNQISQIPTGATTPAQATANQTITQQIQEQNQIINIGGTIGTAIVGSLAAAHILAASLAGPIGAAIAAVVLIVKTMISDAHLYANQLVYKYENPFAHSFEAVINAVSAELGAGTLTQTEVSKAYQALTISWENYEAAMHQLQNSGGDWNIVATQSLNNLDNQYIGVTLSNGKVLGVGQGGVYGSQPNYGFVSSWLDWLNGLMTNPQVIQS